MRAELGLKGLITQRLSLTLRGGYSMSQNSSGESYQGPIGRFNLDYHLEPRFKVGVGYRLQLGDDGYANYFILHRAFVKGTVNLPARLSLNGRFGFDFYDYSQDGIPNRGRIIDRTELSCAPRLVLSAARWLTIRKNLKTTEVVSTIASEMTLARVRLGKKTEQPIFGMLSCSLSLASIERQYDHREMKIHVCA